MSSAAWRPCGQSAFMGSTLFWQRVINFHKIIEGGKIPPSVYFDKKQINCVFVDNFLLIQ